MTPASSGLKNVLHHDIAGAQKAGPPLILVHGVAGSLHIWDPVFDELAARYTVVRLDLLGYGHSPKPRGEYTPRRHVIAIRETLAASGIMPPYNLVGLSMGATLVLEYARLYPDEVSSLVMIGYPYYPSRAAALEGLRGNVWTGLTVAHPLIARLYIPTVWWLGRIGVLPAGSFARIYTPLQAHETLLNPYRVFRSNVWNCMVDVDAHRLLEASAGLPRLFIHGCRDAWSPATGVAQAVDGYANSRFIEVPDAEHNLVVLKPEAVVGAITGFLG